MKKKGRSRVEHVEKAIAIYHRVYAHEGFEQSAQILFKLVQRAQEQWPSKKRHLFLDIDGHRNSKGGFDAEMFELQKEFLMNYLSQFLTRVTTPLFQAENERPQDDAIPAELVFRER